MPDWGTGKPLKDPMLDNCSRCGKVHPLTDCTPTPEISLSADIGRIADLSQGGKGVLSTSQAEFRRGLQANNSTGSSSAYRVGARVRQALLEYYELGVELEESTSGVNRALLPDAAVERLREAIKDDRIILPGSHPDNPAIFPNQATKSPG